MRCTHRTCTARSASPLPGVEVRVGDFDDAGAMRPRRAGRADGARPDRDARLLRQRSATAETIEPDGWLHTGDVAVADEDGRFFIVDRRKDMIITAGYNVYPAEIERVIAGHPAVAMVAVGTRPTRSRASWRAPTSSCAGREATEAEIIEHCRPSSLAAYKLPRSVPVRRRPAEDVDRQDHAPRAAQARRRLRHRKELTANASAGFTAEGVRHRGEARAGRSAPVPASAALLATQEFVRVSELATALRARAR